MENTTDHKPKKDNTIMFYILGGVVVTAVIIAGFVLYKPAAPAPTADQPVLGQQAPTVAPQPTVASKPIGTLACSSQYYNTVNGVPESYYLSTDGEAPSNVTSVTCTVTATINNQVIASDVVTPTLNADATRGGSTFRCTTKGLKLKANVATKVVTDVKDNNGNSVSCNRSFLLP